jgi:hypothetical protein
MINRRYVKVEGHPNLVRDITTNAILNVDSQSSNLYTHKKNKRIEEKEKLQSLIEDVTSLKTDMSEIKTLLRKFLNES